MRFVKAFTREINFHKDANLGDGSDSNAKSGNTTTSLVEDLSGNTSDTPPVSIPPVSQDYVRIS